MSDVFVWDEEYSAPTKAKLTDYTNDTVGVVVRSAESDGDGVTKSVQVDIVTLAGVESVKVTQVRIIRQLGLLADKGTDRAIVSVVPYGRRGIILAPPGKGNHDELVEAVTKA